MKYKSLLLSEASGSVGGLTFSHNKGGKYIRERVIPTNPGTSFQAIVRAAFGGLVAAWANILTEEQRDEWRVYAANVALQDTLGEFRYVTGMNMFLRSNTLRLSFGYGVVYDGPTTYNLGYFTSPGFTVSEAADTVAITFNTNDEWVNETGAYGVLYASRPQNESIQYFKGPYRRAGHVNGHDSAPQSSPMDIPLPFPVVANHKVFFMFCVSRVDGRRSLDFRNSAIAV